ncbi:MAG TPA: tyrosinase family protein [Acidobacteriaceae bacterium]|jgi:tyrosinase
MAQYTRANAWNHGGTFANTDLLWYAKGVGVLQTRKLSDPSSWWFLAAIHGEYVADKKFPGWKFLPAPPPVPVTPLATAKVWSLYKDQCQHQSWFFPPWHRGYLLALEAHVRAAVVQLGGPATWALPYWDYLGPANQNTIPPAFTQKKLPDGSPNPLYVVARYGPDGDSNIYIPTAAIVKQHPHDPDFAPGPVTDHCLSNDLFTGDDASTKPPGFGGPVTGFHHGGQTSGNLENNPHNLVHVYVGGSSPDQQTYGLMSDPGLAALDPIFYVHHANIDRMWAVWNKKHPNPTDPKWLNGPTAGGNRKFVMPMPDGSSWTYTPKQMADLGQLNYTYDNLPDPPAPAPVLAERLIKLGAATAAAKVKEGGTVVTDQNTELVGATEKALSLSRTGAAAAVRLDPGVRRKVVQSLTQAAESAAPDRVYLELENVRGTFDASVLSVYINLPDNAKPADHPELFAGSIALFGLSRASLQDDQHAGDGLSFVLDISKVVDTLHLSKSLDVDSLSVKLVPNREIPDHAQITVGRISIYRKG